MTPFKMSKFQTGIDGDFLEAQWLTTHSDYPSNEAAYFRYPLNVDKKISRATLYMVSGGPHELHFNGIRYFDQLLNPVFVDFSNHLPYNAYDVTDYLSQGLNTIGIVLGNGWYNFPEKTSWSYNEASWRGRPKMKFMISILYEDGSLSNYISRETNTTYSRGILGYNSIYTGEIFRFNASKLDWSKSDFNDETWHQPRSVSFNVETISQEIPPIAIMDTVYTTEVVKISPRRSIAIFPYNFSGITSLRLSGNQGQQYTIRYAERYFEEQGYVDINNLSNHFVQTDNDPLALQQDKIYFESSGEHTFTNSFNYKAFRYVQIDSDSEFELQPEDIIGLFVHTKMDKKSTFQTSNGLINSIAEITERTILSNFHGYPEDCPHREKNGWTGDGHLIARTGMRVFDATLLYDKWLVDHRLSQTDEGNIPNIVPTDEWGYEDTQFDWTVSTILVTWDLYQQTTDPSIIEKHFAMMSEYMNYWISRSRGGLMHGGFGDWKYSGKKPDRNLTSSILFYHASHLMSKMSRITKRLDEAKYYEIKANQTMKRINEEFFRMDSLFYGNGTITEQAMAIYYDLVPHSFKSDVLEYLVDEIKNVNYQIGVGVLGTKVLYSALSGSGEKDLALKLAVRKDSPSYGFSISNGATTLSENLDYYGAHYGGSQNHPYFGSIYDYFVEHLSGYSESSDIGLPYFEIKPSFPEELSNVHFTIESVKGHVELAWEKKPNNQASYYVNIPPNSNMLFIPPNDALLSKINSSVNVRPYMQQIITNGQPVILPNGSYEMIFDLTQSPKAVTAYPHGELVFDGGSVFFSSHNSISLTAGQVHIYALDGKKIFDKTINSFSPFITHLAEVQNKLIKHGPIIFYFESKTKDSNQFHVLKLGIQH
jgi:alpha-L-rhamnosidase